MTDFAVKRHKILRYKKAWQGVLYIKLSYIILIQQRLQKSMKKK
jgi:hypothetical protein